MRTGSQSAQRSGLPRAGPRPRRWRGDAGAALAESAMVLPLFMVMVFAILDFGLLFKDYLTVSNGVRLGARVGSTAADGSSADYDILQAIKRGTSATPSGNIIRVVVWKATGPTDTVPAGCAAGTATAGTGSPLWTGACNVYTPADFAWTKAQFDCNIATSPGPADYNWCATARNAAVADNSGSGPDYLGVWMKFSHPFVTGMFGSTKVFTDYIILKIEPQSMT